MDRRVNQKAFQRGTRAMLDAGIKVRVDLILGLPGDTVDSVRRGIDYLAGLGRVRGPDLQPLDPAGHRLSRGRRAAGAEVPAASAVLRAQYAHVPPGRPVHADGRGPRGVGHRV